MSLQNSTIKIKSEDILSDEFISQYKNKLVNWGFNELGYVVFKRTYARKKEDGTTEEWYETIARCIRGAQKIGANYTQDEAERLFDHIFNLRCCFSGRGLWQLGTSTVDKLGMDSLNNCWTTKVSDIDDFAFIVMESMLGGGVGAVITKEYSQELPRVKSGVRCISKDTKDADYIVPDSKEGWVELWRKILEAYLIAGKSFTYSTVCIRQAGEDIKTFGGIAPGPKPLREGAIELCKILENREGKKLRTQDVADIICCGGQMVKSGGVRRTALILQGDVDDISFINLKRWDKGNIPNYRSNSNNSLISPYFEYIPEKFWEGYNGNGEPCGLINLSTCKKYGRLNETEIFGFKLYDNSIIGVNPCAEANNADKESCNLGELFVNNINSKEEMLDCAILIYKTQKAIAAGNYIHEVTNKIVHKNMRLGLGITGVCQKLDVIEEWSDYVYKQLRKFDLQYSEKWGFNPSIRLTVIKPSGTLSLLAGSMPGGHPGYSEYHIRTVRFSHNDPLIPRLRKCGYKIDPELKLDGTENHDILVVSFPCKFEGGLFAKECGAIKQLEIVKMLQTKWADQAVSVTVYYKKEELDDIKKWLKQNYDDSIKTVSFLLHENHNFPQAPLQISDQGEYEKIMNRIKKLDNEFDTNDIEELLSIENCANGACPVR